MKPLREDIISRAIDAIFDWVKDGREEALRQKFKNDPELISLTDELTELRERIDRHFRNHG